LASSILPLDRSFLGCGLTYKAQSLAATNAVLAAAGKSSRVDARIPP
jgi:hypothetical protein